PDVLPFPTPTLFQSLGGIDGNCGARLEVCESLALPRNQPGKRYMTVDRCQAPCPAELIGDLIGTVHGLPTDLSARKKHYLKTTRSEEHTSDSSHQII